jgi:HlyD family secretion protein
MNKMRMLGICAAILLLLLLLAAVATRVQQKDAAGDNPRLADVIRRSFDIKVSAIGSLDAERSQMVSSTIKGDKARIVWVIDEGILVKKGDVLLRFDPTPFEAEVQRLTGELKSREAVVEAQKQITEWEKSQLEGAIYSADFTTRDTRQEYNRYQSYIADLESLGKKGFQYPTEISQAKKKSDQLNAKLQKAEADLDQVKKEGVFKVAGAMATFNKARSELESTRLALADARGELQKTVILAPGTGIVVHFEQFRDNQKRKPRVGDTVWQNQPLLYLPDISSMMVKTMVREIDLHKIKVGQGVTVRIDAYPAVPFQGRVTSIGILAADGSDGGKGGKFFQLAVTLNGQDGRLRPGMTARIFITAESVKNALTVPLSAIFEEEGRKKCFVTKNGGVRVAEVTIGRQNEDFVEIASGLREGERVSLVRP